MTTTDPNRLKLPARELVLTVREGLLTEPEAGAILFHRAERKLWKLERKQAEDAQDAEPDSPADEP